jgi:membrane associated rhomboid family serine protease
LWEITSRSGMKEITYAYGAIPHSILTFETGQPINPAITVFSSMFMHGGFFHLAGNMLYFWIFGNNIEDGIGHSRFVFFYAFCGVFAAYAHALTNPLSTIPMIGASGAISGVLGAYLLLFPRAMVSTLIFLGFFITTVKIPALIVIGFWAIIQFLNGLISAGLREGGGVAWFAHIGGFLIGLFTIKLWLPRRTKHW